MPFSFLRPPVTSATAGHAENGRSSFVRRWKALLGLARTVSTGQLGCAIPDIHQRTNTYADKDGMGAWVPTAKAEDHGVYRAQG